MKQQIVWCHTMYVLCVPPEHVAGPLCGGAAVECLLLLPGYDAPHTTLAALHPVVPGMLLSMQPQAGQQLVEGGAAQELCSAFTSMLISADNKTLYMVTAGT